MLDLQFVIFMRIQLQFSGIPLCPWLEGIANGVVHYTSRQPGGTATYSCDPGYVLQGAETRTCGQDGSGEWSGQEPSCN